MEISKARIAAIKQNHDLVDVVASYGITLKKKGSNYVGLCPFHEETTPSFTVNPGTQLYHCFGCNAGGDVIGFVAKREGIGFRQAIEKLQGREGTGRREKQDKDETTAGNTPHNPADRTRLLNRVVSFYHTTFIEDHRAMDYLHSRGITENAIFEDFRIGFANGTLLNTIPDDGDIGEALKETGILNHRGHELFYGCAVFPVFNENKDCVGIYGRRITEGETAHLYLPGPRRGVFNYQAAKRSSSLILTESIIDALTLYNTGFKDVIPCYGVNGLTDDHLTLFLQHQTKHLFICFDGDDAGDQGAVRLAGRFKEKGINASLVRLPEVPGTDKVDINSFFSLTADAPAIFEQLLHSANSRAAIRSEKLIKHEEKHYEPTPTGFIVQYGERRYELRGITREGVKLRATIKAQRSGIGGQGSEKSASAVQPVTRNLQRATRFHLDTVDLYSNRSRSAFAKAAAALFTEKEEIIAEDMARLIDRAESWQPDPVETRPSPAMTVSDEQKALDFLKSPDLFARILADFETIGLTGEDANKLMGYIAATSRKLDEPLSILIQSRSAAGKSTLQDAVISLIPTEDAVKYTRLTGQALFYKEEDSLVHKLLAIEEEHGARDASYSIRNIQSSKYLSIAATGKDPATGKLKTEEYKVKGPVALMITTTEVDLDYETSNRFITLTIDESKEMTERILAKQREQETLEGLINKAERDRIIQRHMNAQRLLRPLHVVNPYAQHLSYPSESLRARRDHKKYLGLIKAIAFLHQYQRPIRSISANGSSLEYIEATLDDIEKANTLAAEILGRCLDELSPPSRQLLAMIREMVETRCRELGIDPKECHFTRKDIRDYTRWSDFQVKCHIRQLEDLEYLYSVAGKKGKEYVYELLYTGRGDDGRPFLMSLTTVEQLKEKAEFSTTRRTKL